MSVLPENILLRRIRNLQIKIYTYLIRKRFKSLQSHLSPKVQITNPQYISIGRGVDIRPYTWIYAIINNREKKGIYTPLIDIRNGCSIGRFCHITSSNMVLLEENVFLTERVLITDSIHGFSDINVPILHQDLVSKGPIIIGTGTWIGNGACIVGKVQIGKNCVIGANAVVTVDVPDYSVVVGAPARVVKQYSPTDKQWISVKGK